MKENIYKVYTNESVEICKDLCNELMAHQAKQTKPNVLETVKVFFQIGLKLPPTLQRLITYISPLTTEDIILGNV